MENLVKQHSFVSQQEKSENLYVDNFILKTIHSIRRFTGTSNAAAAIWYVSFDAQHKCAYFQLLFHAFCGEFSPAGCQSYPTAGLFSSQKWYHLPNQCGLVSSSSASNCVDFFLFRKSPGFPLSLLCWLIFCQNPTLKMLFSFMSTQMESTNPCANLRFMISNLFALLNMYENCLIVEDLHKNVTSTIRAEINSKLNYVITTTKEIPIDQSTNARIHKYPVKADLSKNCSDKQS